MEMTAQEVWSAIVATMDPELRAEFDGDEVWAIPLIEGVLKAKAGAVDTRELEDYDPKLAEDVYYFLTEEGMTGGYVDSRTTRADLPVEAHGIFALVDDNQWRTDLGLLDKAREIIRKARSEYLSELRGFRVGQKIVDVMKVNDADPGRVVKTGTITAIGPRLDKKGEHWLAVKWNGDKYPSRYDGKQFFNLVAARRIAPAEPVEYRYGCVNRPPSYGAVPKGAIRIDPSTDKRYRHGIVVYDRPLTEAEIASYELMQFYSQAQIDALAEEIASGFDDYSLEDVEEIIADSPREMEGMIFWDSRMPKATDIGDSDAFVANVIERVRQRHKKPEAKVEPKPEPTRRVTFGTNDFDEVGSVLGVSERSVEITKAQSEEWSKAVATEVSNPRINRQRKSISRQIWDIWHDPYDPLPSWLEPVKSSTELFRFTGLTTVDSYTRKEIPREDVVIVRWADTAEVEDYPYGAHRTKARWYLEKAEKGAQKGKVRVCRETLDPKRGRWNKPHCSTYMKRVRLGIGDNGRVYVVSLDEYGGVFLSGDGDYQIGNRWYTDGNEFWRIVGAVFGMKRP